MRLDLTDEALCFMVSDDGIGGADPARGSGIIGLIDRVDALGGRMDLRSPPAQGTWLAIDLPLDPP